ncbi:hypothetical protein XENORESO_009767 [Xenotaenia resolanae]|uniref:ATP synthase F0 subunit 8 n=1 Tax=Xenotaenia resolanae TaxID=208358 RepID=A0ABV0WE26_9TELE
MVFLRFWFDFTPGYLLVIIVSVSLRLNQKKRSTQKVRKGLVYQLPLFQICLLYQSQPVKFLLELVPLVSSLCCSLLVLQLSRISTYGTLEEDEMTSIAFVWDL